MSRVNKPKHPIRVKRKLARFGVGVFAWLGIAVIYYSVFSFLFDTPVEHGMRQSLAALEEQYDALGRRYDMLERVLDNVRDRDRNLYRTLYDSEPLAEQGHQAGLQRLDTLMTLTNRQLGNAFFDRFERIRMRGRIQRAYLDEWQARIGSKGPEMNTIPSMQPVIDPDLTRIATSFGRRIHPFYRTMVMHNGVDYAVPEETRVFATADGVVAEAAGNRAATGATLVIDHGNGYQTFYRHLTRTLVMPGRRVRRGDIVALTGNSGLSLAPHLHYEITLDGRPVDPTHYFFYEFGPHGYEQVKRQATVGMQSLD